MTDVLAPRSRIDTLLGEGQTLFLVSHSDANLRRFCRRGLYLKDGGLRADGPIEDVIARYARDNGVDAAGEGRGEDAMMAGDPGDTGELF